MDLFRRRRNYTFLHSQLSIFVTTDTWTYGGGYFVCIVSDYMDFRLFPTKSHDHIKIHIIEGNCIAVYNSLSQKGIKHIQQKTSTIKTHLIFFFSQDWGVFLPMNFQYFTKRKRGRRTVEQGTRILTAQYLGTRNQRLILTGMLYLVSLKIFFFRNCL